MSTPDATCGPPAVVGSSFTGLLLSLQLSEAGVDHVLIGGEEPNDVPRLGESLNECASPELFGRFGQQQRDCFFTKSHITLLNGEFATQVHIANPTRGEKTISRYNTANGQWPHMRFHTFWGSVTGRNLMHVDRIQLDKRIYHHAIQQPQCRLVKSLVEQVEVADDAVTALRLDDGTVIDRPRYVLDATGFRGVIAKAAGVAIKPISSPQRVVWAHLHQPRGCELPQRWWRQGTNLLKLEEAVDGYDGISWMIPLGQYVSVGVSVDSDRYPAEALDKQEVIRLLNEAYRRRGVDYADLFPEQRREVVELTHRYYVRERAFGANWLLAGGTYVSIWFPSSAGLWTAVAACRLVPHIFDRPQELGQRYEMVMQPLLRFHEHLEAMVHGPAFRRHSDVYRFWSRWMSDIPVRLGHYLDLPRPSRPAVAKRFRFLRAWGRLMRRFPRLQRLCWGNFVTRSARRQDRSQLSAAFSDYFRPWIFRTRNFLQGMCRWVLPV